MMTLRSVARLATAAALALAAGCAADDAGPSADELLDDAVSGKADAAKPDLEVLEANPGSERALIRNDPAMTIFSALAGSGLHEVETQGQVEIVHAPLIDCAASAVNAACVTQVLDAGVDPAEFFFYDFSPVNEVNAPRAVAQAFALHPDAEQVPPLTSIQLGRVRCLALDPPGNGVPDICVIALDAP